MAARNEAVEAFEANFPWLAGGFENLLRMADLKPLAAAVRPSSRRKGLIALVAGEAPEPEEPRDQEPISDEEPSSLLYEGRTSEGSAFPPASDEMLSKEPSEAAFEVDTPFVGDSSSRRSETDVSATILSQGSELPEDWSSPWEIIESRKWVRGPLDDLR